MNSAYDYPVYLNFLWLKFCDQRQACKSCSKIIYSNAKTKIMKFFYYISKFLRMRNCFLFGYFNYNLTGMQIKIFYIF